MMANDLQTHSTNVELCEPVPAEVAVGSVLLLKIKVSCPAECDLRAMPLEITAPDRRVTTIAADTHREPAEETRDIALQVPMAVGEQTWIVRFPPHEHAGVLHEECSLPVRIRAKPHATSLAVWAVPSPVVMGERFRIRVGAKSSAACGLAGAKILVSDQSGAVIAQGSLGDAPLPGTDALYWTEVELPAPTRDGMFWCTVQFAATELEAPHHGASSRFSVAIVKPPEHRLTVKVLEKETMAPVEDAQVRLGAYRAATDPAGMAEVAMPKGTYDLTVWKVGYEAPGTTVDIDEDVTVQVEVAIVPPENPDAAWLM
jgi:hypothetical protein